MLNAIDNNDLEFYNNLNEDQKKEFSPWVAMRFASSAAGGNVVSSFYLMMVNELVNKNFNDLYKYPALQWKLLACCGAGQKIYHPWIKPPKGVKKNKLESLISKTYPGANYDEIQMMLELNTDAELKQLAKEMGYDDKEIKDLFKGK